MYMTPLDAAKRHTRESLTSSMGKNVLRHIKGDQVLGKHRGEVFVFGFVCFWFFLAVERQESFMSQVAFELREGKKHRDKGVRGLSLEAEMLNCLCDIDILTGWKSL